MQKAEIECLNCGAKWRIGSSAWRYFDRTRACPRCREGFSRSDLVEALSLNPTLLDSLGVTGEELLDTIGPNAGFYCQKWGLQLEAVRWWSWNWSAFIFQFHWAVYRKMYREILIFSFAFLFVGLLAATLVFALSEPWSTIALVVVAGALLATYGLMNALYRIRVLRLIHRARRSKAIEGDRSEFLRRKGGVSATAVAVVVAIEMLLEVLSRTMAI